jgi:hypothetical protein
MKKQPLLVHTIFHPSSQNRKLALHIHRQLNSDIMVPGLRVPTIFSPSRNGNRPPSKLRFDFAERNFIVVLADDKLTISPDWRQFVGDIWQTLPMPQARFVPIQLTENAWPLDDRLSSLSFAKAYLQPVEDLRDAFVIRRIVVELCRYLASLGSVEEDEFKAPITVFLSHAKADLDKDPAVTRILIDCLKGDQPIETWVDSGDIPTGSKFAEAIKAGVERTSLLAVLTDAYATREWCREEVLLAKEFQRPVVVVDALSHYEVRSFPYLGNVPRIRWDGDPQKAIDLLLKETLRDLHTRALLEGYKQPDDFPFARPPELATLIGLEPKVTVLYPDPPVGIGEAKRLAKAKIQITTPFQRLAADPTLKGKKIALSMSESTDIVPAGLDLLHLEESMLEISRYLLIKGATLAYGGFLGSDSYTEKLYELVRTHNALPSVAPVHRIVNYRGWPLPRLTDEQLAKYERVAETVELERPPDLDETLDPDFTREPAFFPAEKSPRHRFAWARGMTEMRALQADKIKSSVVARIVLGGTFGPTEKRMEGGPLKKQWYMSRIPGVFEEVILSAMAGQPVFLIGAFGGVAKLLIDLIQGITREEATWEYQKQAPFAHEMKQIYLDRGLPWLDYPEMVSLLQQKGFAEINPTLSEEEQVELAQTLDFSRILELLLQGLNRL